MTELLSKITLTSFNPKFYAAVLASAGEAYVGTLVGVADKVVKSKGPDGVSEFYGLGGTFAAKIGDKEIRSGKLFMPDAFIDPIISLFEPELNDKGEVVKPGVDSVQLGYHVKLIKADNPAGYSWSLTPIIEAKENDPLSELLAIATKDAPALPKPAAATDGGKK